MVRSQTVSGSASVRDVAHAAMVQELRNERKVIANKWASLSDSDRALWILEDLIRRILDTCETAGRFVNACEAYVEIEGAEHCRARLPWFPQILMQKRLAKVAFDLYWTIQNLDNDEDGWSWSVDGEWSCSKILDNPFGIAMEGANWLKRIFVCLIMRWKWNHYVFGASHELLERGQVAIGLEELEAMKEAIREIDSLRQTLLTHLRGKAIAIAEEGRESARLPPQPTAPGPKGRPGAKPVKGKRKLNRSKSDLKDRLRSLLFKHPEMIGWPVRDIAAQLGCHPGSIAPSRMPELQTIRNQYKDDRKTSLDP